MQNDKMNYTTGLAHLMLIGTSGWALKHITMDTHRFAFVVFSFLLGHGILGILRFTNPNCSYNSKFRVLFDQHSTFLAKLIPLQLFTTQIYEDYQLGREFTIASASVTVIPVMVSFVSPKNAAKLTKILMAVNVGTLMYFGFVYENHWAIGLSALFTLNAIVMGKISDIFSVPSVDIFTVGLTFFNIFAVNTLYL